MPDIGSERVRRWFAMAADRMLQLEGDPDCLVVILAEDGSTVAVLAPSGADENEPLANIFNRKIQMLTIALAAEALDGPGGVRRTVPATNHPSA